MRKAFRQLKTWYPAVSIVVLFLAAYLWYENAKVEAMRQTAESAASVEKIQKDLANSQRIVEAYAESRERVSQYLSDIFPVNNPEALIDRLEADALSHGIRLADLEVDIPKFIEVRGKPEAISLVPFRASFAGDFFSLGKFLENLERAAYLHTITEFELSAESESGRRLSIRLAGALRFFDIELVKEYLSDVN